MDIEQVKDIQHLDVLCCEITIGDPDENNPIHINNPITFYEVLGVEINESYKNLIGTATIKFPKGSLYKSTVVGVITSEGEDATHVTTEIMQDGVIIEKRSSYHPIERDTFKIGQRVHIKLGYNNDLKTMFDGYISGYNSDSIIELQCENLAYKLKLKQAPKMDTPAKGTLVTDVFGEKYNLLKDTGFKLHSETAKYKIDVGKIKVTDNHTVADVLESWSKINVFCFLKYDADSPDAMPAIAVGRPYSSAKSQPSLPSDCLIPFQIRFDTHVAQNGLKVMRVDPKFLAVTGKAVNEKGKIFQVTVRINPSYDPSKPDSKEFQEINATNLTKKEYKLIGKDADTKDKVDLSTYTVVPYTSPNMRISYKQLVEETIDYFKNYNLNGITGNLTLFGDFGLTTAVQVELTDDRNPSKNGVYLVEEVSTSFGTSGYRQRITIPHKIKGEKQTYGNSN